MAVARPQNQPVLAEIHRLAVAIFCRMFDGKPLHLMSSMGEFQTCLAQLSQGEAVLASACPVNIHAGASTPK